MKVIHTRLLAWADGMALTPSLILIHPRHKGDEGLLAHERVHCGQMEQHGTLTFWVKYLLSRSFRRRMEVAAYKVSFRRAPHSLRVFADALANNYWLGLTTAEAEDLITKDTQ